MMQFQYSYIGRMLQFHMHALDENVDPPGGLTKLEFDETKKFILFLDGQFPTQTHS